MLFLSHKEQAADKLLQFNVIVSSVELFYREVKLILVSFAPTDLSLVFLAESEVG